jgi:hypothetical protein
MVVPPSGFRVMRGTDTSFSGGAEIHAGNDHLSGREDGSSQAPTRTTSVSVLSETQPAQARREAHPDRCLYFPYITWRSL